MFVTFYGAVRQVTGSMHMITTPEDRVLLDCGMFQGRRRESAELNRGMPIDPSILTNVVLSHAHIDHSGRIPLLVKKGFPGRIFSTRATLGACEYLLADSAHIQESDANYLNYKAARLVLAKMQNSGKSPGKKQISEAGKQLKNGKNRLNPEAIDQVIHEYGINRVEPLYSIADAKHALGVFEGIPYRHTVTLAKNMTLTFYEAGHILGSAVSMINYQKDGKKYTIAFTGDLGRFDKPILKDPALNFAPEHRDVDLLIMESTYGNRVHEKTSDLYDRLKEELNKTFEQGGSVVIPSFAFGRSQELLYVIHELRMNQDIPKVPVYVDSPLAVSLTKVFGEHPEIYDEDTHETFLRNGKNPFWFDGVHFISSVEESMDAMRLETPHIVISASGMCEVGRILHHLRYKIHNPKNTILVVGYMAAHTLGRKILTEGEAYMENGRKGPAPVVKILGKEYPLEAKVVQLGGFSAHADKNEMMRFLTKSNLDIKKIAVVHGEEDSALAFADLLQENNFKAVVPRPGESLIL